MATSTQNRPGTKAKDRYVRMSASKARVVLNLIRGKRVEEAMEILQFTERLAAQPIDKCLRSAVANAEHNEEISADELFISACFADEGPTIKRFRPRARGRAGRINKQTCHITIEVARLTEDELDELRKREDLKNEGRQSRRSTSGGGGGDRARRVAKSRAADEVDETEADQAATEADEVVEEATAEAAETTTDETTTDEVTADEASAEAEVAEDAEPEVAEDAADEAEPEVAEAASDDAEETDNEEKN